MTFDLSTSAGADINILFCLGPDLPLAELPLAELPLAELPLAELPMTSDL